MKKSIFLLILMAFVLITPSGVKAMLPWFAQDWQCQLFNGGVTQYPETVKLIENNAADYSENYNHSGDGFYFQNINGLKTSHYLGLTNLWYGGLPPWADPNREAMQVEENFYHGSDPSSLVGWRTTNVNGNPVNILRWDWDFRFVDLPSLYSKDYSDKVNRYKIFRREVGQSTWTEVNVVQDQNWYEDTNMPNSVSIKGKPPGFAGETRSV